LRDYVAQIIRADAKNYSSPKAFAEQSDYFFTFFEPSFAGNDESSQSIIAQLLKALPQDSPWTPEELKPLLKQAIDEWCVKNDKLAKEAYKLLRGLLSNGKPGPGVYDIMAILGREETLRRLGTDLLK
jgi:glutamyl-tRNA synthetase